MKVIIIEQTMANKEPVKAGDVVEVSKSVAALLIHTKKAVLFSDENAEKYKAVADVKKKSGKGSKADKAE